MLDDQPKGPAADVPAVLPTAAPPRGTSFRALVQGLDDVDRILDEGIDPETIREMLMSKTDGVKHVLDYLRSQAARFGAIASRLENEAEGLESYVFRTMKDQGLEQVPGKTVCVKIVKAGRRPVILNPHRMAPTDEDYLAFPNLIRVIPPVRQSYEWDKKAIYDAIQVTGELIDENAPRGEGEPAKVIAVLGPQTERLKWSDSVAGMKSRKPKQVES